MWEAASVDSGFGSDASFHLRPAESTSPGDFPTSSKQNKDNSKSLPSNLRRKGSFRWNEVVLDDFDHVKYLGGGGYARVDLVKFNTNSKHKKEYYALKKISKKLLTDKKQEAQFENEKGVLKMAESRFIPRLFRTFRTPNHVFLLTEACLGGDLFSYLEHHGVMGISVARYVVACVTEALDYLHRVLHVIHRDVKTENLLIGEGGVLKLADLGFCKVQDKSSAPTFTFCGTPGYIAPEVILHTGHTYSADFFSLGVVTYELLTCRSPFRRNAVMDTHKATLRGITEIAFPSTLDFVTCTFIRALCYREAARRLGSDIRHHDWFYGFNWNELRSGRMMSPLKLTR
uniref:Protein kinase domain-containing protein n=1 Tax=Ciona savignyi TaxID=51511 RepID=H2YXE3_CIOSA